MKTVRNLLLTTLTATLFFSCDTNQEKSISPSIRSQKISTSGARVSAVDPATSQLTSHFQTWLSNNGYSSYNFALGAGFSYGGKTSNSDLPINQPVIFIHGNADRALGTAIGQTGWTSSINYFLDNGYKSSEIYTITWGPSNALLSAQQYHSKEYLTRIRKFIEAVKAYTGATKVDIVGHSMGVTLARKAIKGGASNDLLAGGNYNLGSPINYVDSFVGIAGANRGLTSCYSTGGSTPTCANTNGFYPGYLIGFYGPYGVSNFLTELNSNTASEATYKYSIWSSVDEIVQYGCIVYGVNTCKIPNQTGEKSYSNYPYGHFGLKDLTPAVQLNMLKNHNPN
jgi:triacylglycerol lipase